MLQHTHVIKFAFASVVALGLSLATQEAKAATTIGYSGSNCSPNKASLNFVEYNAFSILGLGDPAIGTPAQVSCPLPVQNTAGGLPGTLNSVKVVVLDRNNGAVVGPTKDFTCTIFYQNSAGTTFTGATQTPNFFSANALSFTLTQNTSVVAATMLCSIPNPQGGSFSHILNYSVTTTS